MSAPVVDAGALTNVGNVVASSAGVEQLAEGERSRTARATSTCCSSSVAPSTPPREDRSPGEPTALRARDLVAADRQWRTPICATDGATSTSRASPSSWCRSGSWLSIQGRAVATVSTRPGSRSAGSRVLDQTVTNRLKVLVVMSQRLPGRVIDLLTKFVCGIEDALQANAHKIDKAVAQHPAFDVRWVESPLVRAVIASSATLLESTVLRVEHLGNGGLDIRVPHDGVDLLFRVKLGHRDKYGALVVTVSSDSILVATAHRLATLFDDPDEEPDATSVQRWVLAYELDPATRTLINVSAARVVGVANDRSPFRLSLADIVQIPHAAPLPPSFPGRSDDLDLGDEGEEGGEEAV
jgi:hypothetical protein